MSNVKPINFKVGPNASKCYYPTGSFTHLLAPGYVLGPAGNPYDPTVEATNADTPDYLYNQ